MTVKEAVKLMLTARYGADRVSFGIVPIRQQHVWDSLWEAISRYATYDELPLVLEKTILTWLTSIGMQGLAPDPEPEPNSNEPVPALPRPKPFDRKFS